MPDFSEFFDKTNGQPTEYKEFVIRLGDFIPVHNKDEFLLTFEHFGSEWIQGVSVGFHTKGNAITINDHSVKNGCGFWQDTAPKEVFFRVGTKKAKDVLTIWNVWKDERGIIQSRHYGAAMVREEIPNGARYRCNDGHPDEDFEDLIFTLVKIKGIWELPLEKSPFLNKEK